MPERRLDMTTKLAARAMSMDTVTRVVLLLDESPLSEDLEQRLENVDFRDDVEVEVRVTRGRLESRPTLVWFEGDVARRIRGRASVAFLLSEIATPDTQ